MSQVLTYPVLSLHGRCVDAWVGQVPVIVEHNLTLQRRKRLIYSTGNQMQETTNKKQPWSAQNKNISKTNKELQQQTQSMDLATKKINMHKNIQSLLKSCRCRSPGSKVASWRRKEQDQFISAAQSSPVALNH